MRTAGCGPTPPSRPNPADFFPVPSVHDEFVPFGAAGLLGIISAVDGRDPVIRQLRKLIKSGSR